MTNTLYDALFAPHAANENDFLKLPDGSSITFAEFVAMSGQYAHALRQLDLQIGDRLVVQTAKSARALAIYAACIRAGIIYLPLNTAYTTREVEYFVENSGARVMLCDVARMDALQTALPSTHCVTQNPDGTGTLDRAADTLASDFVAVDRSPDDLAAFLYTSGTTGRSKGAMLSHKNLLSNARVLAHAWRFGPTDSLLHALPIFHTHGLFVATNICLLAGASMILLHCFDRDEMIRLMPRATSVMGVPTFYTRLLDDPRFDATLTGHMRLFISGSAPMLADTHKKFTTRTGHKILERYGMTETNMNTSNPYEGDRRPGTVGLPLPGVELKVCDADGQEVPRGTVGTIEVRGDNVFQGYWNMPEKTAAELRSDGFFITGDLGIQQEDGYVTIVGRGKDLIISGGFNIYPKEVEEILDAQPGVIESAVIAVPHPDFGESPVAVLAIGAGAVDLPAIKAALAQQLAAFKCPKHYELRPELPRNTMGKVQKAQLRAEFSELFQGA